MYLERIHLQGKEGSRAARQLHLDGLWPHAEETVQVNAEWTAIYAIGLVKMQADALKQRKGALPCSSIPVRGQ